MFWSKIVSAAPIGLSVGISRMNSGMSIEVGQACHARRVVAEVAAVGLDEGLVLVERRMQVGEIGGVLRGRQPPGGDAFLELTFGHPSSPLLVLAERLARIVFLSIGQILASPASNGYT